ncbi:MAG: hypothetical protein QOH35_4073 [Acidobacteriaceae bacterium]|nr:hypothetical protein [Acidobacteriaceae bacterium]
MSVGPVVVVEGMPAVGSADGKAARYIEVRVCWTENHYLEGIERARPNHRLIAAIHQDLNSRFLWQEVVRDKGMP